MAKGRNGGSDTLSAESIGFGSGMKGGDGGGFALNQASADMGNRFAQDQGGGGLLGGFFNPGRMIGSGIGTLVAGPIGGILGGLIGGGIGRNRQQGGWGYTDAEGNRVSAFRDMFDGGGRGRFGDTFQGGLLSGVANSMGIRPAGYRARQAAMGQQQPDYVGDMAAPVSGGVVPTGGAASPMAAPADVAPPPTYLPINMNGVVAGSGQTPANGYMPAPSGLPINMRGVVAGSGQTPATGYASMPMANPPAPLPAGTTLPRATPSLSALEAYVSGNPTAAPAPMAMNSAPSNPPPRSRSEALWSPFFNEPRVATGVPRPSPSALNSMMFQNPNPMGLLSQPRPLPRYNPVGRLAPMSASGGYFSVYPEPF